MESKVQILTIIWPITALKGKISSSAHHLPVSIALKQTSKAKRNTDGCGGLNCNNIFIL